MCILEKDHSSCCIENLPMGREDWNRGAHLRGFYNNSGERCSEKWADCGCILKLEPTGFAGGLEAGTERGVRGDTKILA